MAAKKTSYSGQDIQVLEGTTAEELREIDSRRVNWRRVGPNSFPYHLRQPPGPHNPLGRIKFAFASPFGVYLHGTPGGVRRRAPLAGEHTQQVLQDFGFAADEIAALQAEAAR